MTPDDLPEFVIHLDHQAERAAHGSVPTPPAAGRGTGCSGSVTCRATRRSARRSCSCMGRHHAARERTRLRERSPCPMALPCGSLALRALADPKDPSSWDTWTSPVITIARASATRPAVAVRAARVESLGALALAPAEPNPFTSDRRARFALPASGPVDLEVFDPMGRRLRSWRWSCSAPVSTRSAADGRADSGSRAPAGMLLVRLTALGRTASRASWCAAPSARRPGSAGRGRDEVRCDHGRSASST